MRDCAFFQDDASSVFHGPAVCVEAAGGPAVVPGSAGHPHLLPGNRRMELPEDFRQDSWQRLAVSTGILCVCVCVLARFLYIISFERFPLRHFKSLLYFSYSFGIFKPAQRLCALEVVYCLLLCDPGGVR